MARWLVVVCVASLGVPTVAFAGSDRDVEISYYVDREGVGFLTAHPAPDGWGSVAWRRCPPDGSACVPMDPDRQSDRIVHVGDAEAGSVFEATATGGGTTLSRRSDPYRGPIRMIEPPRILGEARVGALVRPVAAQWEGAWGGEQPFLQLQVCREAAGRECRVISSTFYWDECPGTAAVLSPRYVGWYVRVADQRVARQPIFPAYAVHSPEALEPLVPGPNVATATTGPIRAASGTPESTCGAPRPVPRAKRRLVYRCAPSLCAINADGSGWKRLTRPGTAAEYGDFAPAVSPDGRLLAFERQVVEGFAVRSEIYISRIDGTRVRRLRNEARFDARPAWSPDGERVAFESLQFGIAAVRSDGSGLRRLTDGGGRDHSPAWSPDGKRIAYVRHNCVTVQAHASAPACRAVSELRVLRFDTLHSTRLLIHDGFTNRPTWSPDGQTLLAGTDNAITQIGRDRSNRREIVSDGGWPAWSSSGTRILFQRPAYLFQQPEYATPSIYSAKPDGRGVRFVTSGQDAAWIERRPRPPN